MRKVLVLLTAVLIVCVLAMVACNKGAQNSSTQSAAPAQGSPAATSAPAGDDAMSAELRKLAGSDASDCGRVGPGGDVSTASDCAMKANDANKPFYVRYDLPVEGGLYAIGTVRAGDGKLTTVQFDSKGFEKAPEKGTISEDKKTIAVPCDPKNPLRLASSGRVTCFPPTNMGATMGGASPHGGMGGMMGGAKGANPHGGDMQTPPAPMSETKSH